MLAGAPVRSAAQSLTPRSVTASRIAMQISSAMLDRTPITTASTARIATDRTVPGDITGVKD
jgi:hypothetical protein